MNYPPTFQGTFIPILFLLGVVFFLTDYALTHPLPPNPSFWLVVSSIRTVLDAWGGVGEIVPEYLREWRVHWMWRALNWDQCACPPWSTCSWAFPLQGCPPRNTRPCSWDRGPDCWAQPDAGVLNALHWQTRAIIHMHPESGPRACDANWETFPKVLS